MRIPKRARFEKCRRVFSVLGFFFSFLFFFGHKITEFFFLSPSLMKLSWPKTLVKKWFNIKSKAEDFQADDVVYGGDYFNLGFWDQENQNLRFHTKTSNWFNTQVLHFVQDLFFIFLFFLKFFSPFFGKETGRFFFSF